MSATIVPWPERALKLRIEVNTSLVIKLGPWTVYGTSILFMPKYNMFIEKVFEVEGAVSMLIPPCSDMLW